METFHENVKLAIGLESRAVFGASRDKYAAANILDRWVEKVFVPRNLPSVVRAVDTQRCQFM